MAGTNYLSTAALEMQGWGLVTLLEDFYGNSCVVHTPLDNCLILIRMACGVSGGFMAWFFVLFTSLTIDISIFITSYLLLPPSSSFAERYVVYPIHRAV